MKTVEFTDNQKYCIEALGHFAKGRHHLPDPKPHGSGVCVNWYGMLSTFDNDLLTRLVLTAHAFYVRVEIKNSGPRMVKICAWRRDHGDVKELGFDGYHPDLNDLIDRVNSARNW